MKKITLDQNTINEIIRLYNEEMLGSPSISEKIGISKSIIVRILKENGVNVGKSGRKFKGGKSESDKRYYKNNRDKRLKYFSEWQKENREHLNTYHQTWRDKNIDKHREYKRKYEKHRKDTDPIYKLISNFRTAIYQVLKESNVEKNKHYFDVLQYTPEELIVHLELQFKDSMNWDNYGFWHVDHKLAITHFNIQEMGDEEFMKCWSLENLQPMWAEENIRKSNKIILIDDESQNTI
jgi:hypothetical protein